MLTRRTETSTRFSRRDIPRVLAAGGILVLALGLILGADILPAPPLDASEGQLATRDIVAPKAHDFESEVQTSAARKAASDAVPFQYTFTTENAIAIAASQQVALEDHFGQIDTTFSADLSAEGRKTLLQTAVPGLSAAARETLVALDVADWATVRTEAARVLDATLRTELRDTEVEETRLRLAGRMAGGLDEAERMLAAELIAPLVVANSSLDLELTETARAQAAAEVTPVRVAIRQGEVIVRNGSPLTAIDIEKIDALGLSETVPDVASLGGWFLLALLVVGLLLAWIWRFRPALWHRNNVLILIGLLLVGATLALKVTAGPADVAVLPPDCGDRHAPRDPARCVHGDDRHRHRRPDRRGGERRLAQRRLARIRGVHLPGWRGRPDRGPPRRPAPGVRPGGGRRVRGERPRGDRLLAARHARPARHPRALVRLRRIGRRIGHRHGRHVCRARLGVRDPDRVPAARAGEPVAAAAAPAAGRDARHVPPLADGRQPRRAGRRGHRRRSAGDPRGGLLPRRRQAGEPARRSSRTRPAARTSTTSSTRRSAPGSSSSTSPTGSTWPTRRACQRRSSPTSRSTTGPRS